MRFFDKNLFLTGKSSIKLYNKVKDLPIIDYHCHLDQNEIANDSGFSDIGELWLKADHYKWRSMRLCGIDEYYITGDADYKDKFIKYASIMPKLAGSPLYYWTHMELKQIFGIDIPLRPDTAEEIYSKANEVLKTLKISNLFKKFNVEFVATTDDPIHDLNKHKKYGETLISPTFRPDNLYSFDEEYISSLANVSGIKINNLDNLLKAVINRLDFFISKGCVFSDHGFEKFPKNYATKDEADKLFDKRGNLTTEEKDSLFGFLLNFLGKEYKKRGIKMQIHFAVVRNNNPEAFPICGKDSGFDLIGEEQSVKDLIRFLATFTDEERPEIILYTLNDSNLQALTAVTGAFRGVVMGAAWWFNDTVEGIRKNLSTIAEYSVLGTNLGMLTDSRSFSSYVRFDFFRRILCGYLGDLVDKGEFDFISAVSLAKDVCYNNVKNKITK